MPLSTTRGRILRLYLPFSLVIGIAVFGGIRTANDTRKIEVEHLCAYAKSNRDLIVHYIENTPTLTTPENVPAFLKPTVDGILGQVNDAAEKRKDKALADLRRQACPS